MSNGSWSKLYFLRGDSDRIREAAPPASTEIVSSGSCRLGRRGGFSPTSFPPISRRRLKHWEDEGVSLNAAAQVAGGAGPRATSEVRRGLSRQQLRQDEKGAPPSRKPSGARGRSGWYWSTVRVFRWEFGWKVPLRVKLRLRQPRWPRSVSRHRKATHGKSRGA